MLPSIQTVGANEIAGVKDAVHGLWDNDKVFCQLG